MFNLLISLGALLLGYTAGHLSVDWTAGLLTGIFAFGVTMFLLWRRTSRQLEAVALGAQTKLQTGDVQGARAALEAGMELGRWQFLVREQLHGQLGQLHAMEAVGVLMQGKRPQAMQGFEAAREHLEKSWSRDWTSRSTLGVVLQRLGRRDESIAVFEAASGPASGEPLFWGLYAWVLHEGQERDKALAVIGRGLAENKGNGPLIAVQEALSNKRRPDFGAAFGERWYQLFPDQMSQEQLIAMYEQTTGKKVPPGARVGPPGAGPQGGGPRGPVRPPKTYPMPRR
jgi:tetratricopeptide (TPR) repeat protein